ncbi:uncharacterized protein SPAPADRAFT_55077 [Spathaspora passalidarum NRRL Y-27907]|uniref:Agglutinin-like protein N-terminal domain-containing protein n=1 Tax=Spathaspora passalidarum (strain NRRL Y-27907 / 11-Y1) TaxID=619300 RepID=G3ALA3_SPAPN|nr:uncharacterized protein SPAPADRAFT_55077 [Spathaspora passalidarum NRRL Y-27907]EGW33146.1 hypothetical protein SPAPADRAFT_55077 [Spathaspora passalidarum NRRL Y-27907]
MSAGDTFTLTMPCVFKFTSDAKHVDLNATHSITGATTTFATCYFNPGELLVTYSELLCVLSDEVDSETKAYGAITIPVTFNNGRGASDTDLECAAMFHSGTTTVSFRDGDNILSIDVEFEKGCEYLNPLLRHNRISLLFDNSQLVIFAAECPDGYDSGTLGIQLVYEEHTINCNYARAAITNELNDWCCAKSIAPFTFTTICNQSTFIVEYENIPAGYRPFLDILVRAPPPEKMNMTYIETHYCSGSSELIDNTYLEYWGSYINKNPWSDGREIVLTTRTYTGKYTTVTTLSFDTSLDKTKTIVVEVPIPTTTITTTYGGKVTTRTTKTVEPGETATVIELPDYVTI